MSCNSLPTPCAKSRGCCNSPIWAKSLSRRNAARASRSKRTPKLLSLAPAAATEGAEVAAATVQSALESAPAEAEAPAAILVAAPCVGVFHAAKDALEVGSATRRKQLLGVVESLKVPNEIYAPAAGVVAQIWVGDGQGVEWGQPLFEIQPALEKNEG